MFHGALLMNDSKGFRAYQDTDINSSQYSKCKSPFHSPQLQDFSGKVSYAKTKLRASSPNCTDGFLFTQNFNRYVPGWSMTTKNQTLPNKKSPFGSRGLSI